MQDILSHIQTRLNEVPTGKDPFPHSVIDSFLPHDFFERLVTEFPGDNHFIDAHQTSQARKNLMYQDDQFNTFLKQSQAWREFAAVCESEEFQKLMLGYFLQSIVENGGKISETDEIQIKFDISRAAKGYTRSCHLDRRNHIISMLLYLNENAEWNGEGGDLVLYGSNQSEPPFDKFPGKKDIFISQTVSPKPNRLAAFINTSNGYHGVTPITKGNGYRKFVYIAIDNVSVEDMWPETTVASEERRQSFLAE